MSQQPDRQPTPVETPEHSEITSLRAQLTEAHAANQTLQDRLEIFISRWTNAVNQCEGYELEIRRMGRQIEQMASGAAHDPLAQEAPVTPLTPDAPMPTAPQTKVN